MVTGHDALSGTHSRSERRDNEVIGLFRDWLRAEVGPSAGVDTRDVPTRKSISWQRIGDILGTSAQAAQQRYGSVVESA